MIISVNIKKADKCPETKYSMFLSFEYDARAVEQVRTFSNKWWHANIKQWELPLKELGKLTQKLDWCEFDITGQYVEMETRVAKPIDGFEFKTKPFEHQITGFEYGLKNDRWLLADEQGLGKTKQVIDIAVAKKMQYGYKHCLIICGVNGLKWNWLNEIGTHSNEKGHILGQRYSRGKVTVGGNKDKLTDLCILPDAYFLITNVESLRDKDIQDKVQELCKAGTIGVVAIDEIHKCKDPTSQQGKGILKATSEIRIAMTGTPIMNNPMDCYIIMKWLGHETHSFYAFRNHYCEMGGFGGYQIVGYKNLPELQERLDEIMLRRRKGDVLDLPEKTHINEYVEMSPKQKRIYDEVTSEIRMNIDQIAVSPNPLAQLIRMRQATGYTGILSSEIQESAKLDRMQELVDEALESGKQVVIFSNWTLMTDAIENRFSSKGFYNFDTITGDIKDEDRQYKVNAFQNGDVKVLIGTIGAMGTGLTLTAGTVEIFMDEPWNKALKDQAEDRCHRVGTTQNVTIYTLICKNTIDERVNELVEKKGMMADALIDGNITMDKLDLLNFLVN